MISKRLIGLMSGTSMDGVDIADVQFTKSDVGKWSHEIMSTHAVSYPRELLGKLSNSKSLPSEELTLLDKEISLFFSKEVNTFIETNKINKTEIDAIASHGHTVFHQPEKGFTLQIGCGAILASKTDLLVINDFRTKDVIAGGQGAPLVPIGDSLLFSDKADGFLNIGGFANLCVLNEPIIAFDISPGNLPINELMQKHHQQNYDKDGLTARCGSLIPKLLNDLNSIKHYSAPPPKSLGTEWLDGTFTQIIENYADEGANDVIHTVTAHIADQIVRSLNSLRVNSVMITGGGALNLFLIELIRAKFRGNIILPERELIEYKEAIIFAFLGALNLDNSVNTIPSVTGATNAVIGGVKHLP